MKKSLSAFKLLNISFILILFSGTVYSQTMIKNINGQPYQAITQVSDLNYINNKLIFTAFKDTYGKELWSLSDNSNAPVLVKNITPGPVNTEFLYFTQVNSTLFFSANGDLWKSDGTEAGTIMLKDFPDNNSIESIVGSNGMVYMAVDDNVHGRELWKSDGTVAGTSLVVDMTPGAASTTINNLYSYGGKAYFYIYNSALFKLIFYVSDGTSTGTNEFDNTLNITGVVGTFKGDLILLVKDPIDTYNYFYKTNGITTTKLIKWTGAGPRKCFEYNNKLYVFSYNNSIGDAIYVTDCISQMDILTTLANGISYIEFYEGNGGVYFSNLDLYFTNGTVAGTYKIDYPTYVPNNPTKNKAAVYFNGKLHFAGLFMSDGMMLYSTDGSTKTLIMDPDPGVFNSNLSHFTLGNGCFYFVDIIKGKLFRSDGTAGGTVAINDPQLLDLPSNPRNCYASSLGLFFVATHYNENAQLWKTDGINAEKISSFLYDTTTTVNPAVYPNALCEYNSEIYFTAKNLTQGYKIYKTDGIPGNVVELTAGSTNLTFKVYDGSLYYTWAQNGLWKINSNIASKVLVNSLVDNYALSGLSATQDYLFFFSNNQLWRSDGTPAGTVQLTSNLTAFQTYSLAIDSIFYFCGKTSTAGYELWRSNGTASGTYMVKDFYPGNNFDSPYFFTEFNKRLYFSHGWQHDLWSTSHDTSTTEFIQSFNTSGEQFSCMNVFNNELYFGINQTNTNTQPFGDLYKLNSSNTPLKIIRIDDGKISNLLPFNNQLIIRVENDPVDGSEIWIIDDNHVSPAACDNIVAGNGSSNPDYLTIWNNQIFYSATDGIHGFELWTADNSSLVPNGIFSSNTKDSDYNFFPNPTAGKFTITSKKGAFDAELFNANGIKIKGLTSDLRESLEFNISELPEGIYIVRIIEENHSNSFKIVKY